MTQVDDAPDGTVVVQSVVGEVLADRYRLEEHINDDAAGRQVWRGTDIVLRRPVAMVLRHPGGDAALEMLSAAVTASRVVHPNLVGVYDAVDEGARAYVVREWIDGQSLREQLLEAPLEPRRAAVITHSVADACAAIHATGVAHGNVHPGTVLIGDEGRVMLADARVTDATSQEADVRAIGAVLYAALTGHWPHELGGNTLLPDALRIDGRKVASPRQVRSGIPTDLDELCMELLDETATAPTAAELTSELARFGPAPLDSFLGSDNPTQPGPPRVPGAARARRMRIRLGLVVAGVLVIALTGTLVLASLLPGDAKPGPNTLPQAAASGSPAVPQATATVLQIASNQVRIVDPPDGSRDELVGAEKTVDGKPDTGWQSNWYQGDPVFGKYKKGMGVLIDLGKSYNIASVEVLFAQPGATVELRSGTEDPGNTTAGDGQISTTYTPLADPTEATGVRQVLTGKDNVRYLLVWITKLPPIPDGKFQVGIQEITVRVH